MNSVVGYPPQRFAHTAGMWHCRTNGPLEVAAEQVVVMVWIQTTPSGVHPHPKMIHRPLINSLNSQVRNCLRASWFSLASLVLPVLLF